MRILHAKAHKTAITRRNISTPMKYLREKQLLQGRKLDYGCGKGFDADFFRMEKYDPYFQPIIPSGKFDTITCNYVFNVLPIEHEQFLLDDIKKRLSPGGKAYISVRRDIKRDGETKTGTYQRRVELDLPIVKKNGTFCMYELTGE